MPFLAPSRCPASPCGLFSMRRPVISQFASGKKGLGDGEYTDPYLCSQDDKIGRYFLVEGEQPGEIYFTSTFSRYCATCTFHPKSFFITSRSWPEASGSPCTRYVTPGWLRKVCNHSNNSGGSAWSLNCSRAATCARIGTESPNSFNCGALLLIVNPRVPGA